MLFYLSKCSDYEKYLKLQQRCKQLNWILKYILLWHCEYFGFFEFQKIGKLEKRVKEVAMKQIRDKGRISFSFDNVEEQNLIMYMLAEK